MKENVKTNQAEQWEKNFDIFDLRTKLERNVYHDKAIAILNVFASHTE